MQNYLKDMKEKKKKCNRDQRVVIVFNATFINISVISRRSPLLVEETGENYITAEKSPTNSIR